MWNKNFEKAKKSEWVIRNSLYWMTTYTRWELDEDETNWYIYFDSFNEEINFEFERLVNDFQLRESLQMQTGNIRNSIINNVLKSIDERLTQ